MLKEGYLSNKRLHRWQIGTGYPTDLLGYLDLTGPDTLHMGMTRGHKQS